MQLDPHDPAAEQAVLGAAMLSPAEAQRCAKLLDPQDFYRGLHQSIFAEITAAVRDGEPTDAVSVKARLDKRGERYNPTYLHDLLAATPAAVNGAYWARIVREHAIRRRLLVASRRIAQRAYEEPGAAGELTEWAVREVESARDEHAEDTTVPTITEFLATPDSYDWVVEGLMEEGDRLVLTGGEGLGKSTFVRQMAVTIAAGIHPFSHQPIEPQRVLIVDCENGAMHTRRKIRPLVLSAERAGAPVAESNLFLDIRPNGMDLAADKDVSQLLRTVAQVGPRITFIGPLYKLAPRAMNSDDEASPVLAALNLLRERGSCVVLEAHAGHTQGANGRDWRPRGSAAFMGWPEFGYGMRLSRRPGHDQASRVVDFVSWRGDRDERAWPEMLAAGGVWPWRVFTPRLQSPPGEIVQHDFGSGAFD